MSFDELSALAGQIDSDALIRTEARSPASIAAGTFQSNSPGLKCARSDPLRIVHSSVWPYGKRCGTRPWNTIAFEASDSSTSNVSNGAHHSSLGQEPSGAVASF